MAETAKSPPQVSPGLVSSQMVKVYVVALVLVILAELIGFVRWTPIEKITILLVPFVHTIWLAVLFAPQAVGRWVKVYTLSDSAWAAGIILTATYPLMVRYGTLVGPNVPKLLQAGVALILQEAGNNWGAIVMAMPIAILLGLRREVIGACYSVAREPNLSLLADIYGLDSPEGRGVIGTYITGTVLGTAFFSIIGSLFALTAPAIFHPLAFVIVNRPLMNYRDTVDPGVAERANRLFMALLDAGIMINSNSLACLSTPMAEAEVDQIESAVDRALSTLREG